ncbi:MAG: hypothetical protein U0Q16_29945 [Bryobacteraceae bacterium]
MSDWVEDTVTSLITYRYNNNKALITTTNLRDQQAGDAALPRGWRVKSPAATISPSASG